VSTCNDGSRFANGISRVGAIGFGWAFLGSFAELRKATASVVRCVSPSFHMEQLGSN